MTAYFSVPREDAYGYAQAIKVGDTIHVSRQVSQDEKEDLIAAASLDETRKPTDFSMMAQQMRVTYANAEKILAHFGANPTQTWWKKRSLFSMSIRRLRSLARCARSLRDGAPSVGQQSDRLVEAGLS